MSFLDKTGLERLWQNILIKLGNKVDKAVINGGITTPEIGMSTTALYFIGPEVMQEGIQFSVTISEGSPFHQILNTITATMNILFSGPDIDNIYPSCAVGDVGFEITSNTTTIDFNNTQWNSYTHDLSGNLTELGITSAKITSLPEDIDNYVEVKTTGNFYTKAEVDEAISNIEAYLASRDPQVYVQSTEPTDVPIGAIWVDTSVASTVTTEEVNF